MRIFGTLGLCAGGCTIAAMIAQTQTGVFTEKNYILKSLPASEYETLRPQLQDVELAQHEVLYDVGVKIDSCYFVRTGLIASMVVMQSGESAEVGLLGDEGFVGLPVLLNIEHSSTLTNVQISGSASKIKGDSLHAMLPRLPMLNRMLSRFGYLQALQAQQLVGCNRLHEMEERLARWILMTQDRVQSSTLELTHDLMAAMLGSRRASVTVSAGILQRAGIIDYRRGKLHILNRELLEKASCECYGLLHSQLNAYLHTSLRARPPI